MIDEDFERFVLNIYNDDLCPLGSEQEKYRLSKYSELPETLRKRVSEFNHYMSFVGGQSVSRQIAALLYLIWKSNFAISTETEIKIKKKRGRRKKNETI